MVKIRAARPDDAQFWCEMRHALWPEGSAEEHAEEIEDFFAGRSREPLAVLVAESLSGQLAGFAELSIRPYAEGCATGRVGFLEGWYVIPEAADTGGGTRSRRGRGSLGQGTGLHRIRLRYRSRQ